MVRKLKVRGIDSLSDLSQAIYDTTGYGVRQALDGKQTILVPGVTIKTINGQSILGSGDLVIASGGNAGGSTNQIQYNSGGSFAGSASFIYDDTSKALTINALVVQSDGTALGSSLHTQNAATDSGTAPSLQIYAGASVSGIGGTVSLKSGVGQQSGNIAIIASNGYSSTTPDSNGGNLFLSIGAKTGSGSPGAFVLKHGVTTVEDVANPAVGNELLRINANGAWSTGVTGVNFGSAGQLFASAGAGAPPSWLTATEARENLNTGDFTPITDGLQLVCGGVYSGDTTASTLTAAMPSYANSKLGSRIVIFNTRYNWATNKLTVQVGSEHIIRNAATDLECDTTFDAVTLVCVYKDGAKAHWNII